jgi:hypothetical protein
VDQIFDRFERLFKSWVAQEADLFGKPAGRAAGQTRRSGNADYDDAMAELDDFLDKDRAAAEERTRARAANEERQRTAAGAASRPAGPDPRLLHAFEVLGLPFGTPFPAVKAEYKKLLMKHHPDLQGGDRESQRRATERSALINAAYQVLETWSTTGTVPD